MNYEFGEFLYQLRKEKGLTQAELADMLGITNKAISKWETGESFPETAQLIPLSKIFNITVDELLNGKRNDQLQVVEQEKPLPELVAMTKKETVGTALSVALILVGVLSIIILNFNGITYRIGVPVLLFCVAIAVFFLIFITMRRRINSVEMKEDDYKKGVQYSLMIAGGVAVVICAAAAMVGLSYFGTKIAFSIFFAILIVGIFLLVLGGISWDTFNKRYKLPSEDAPKTGKAKRLEDAICGVIMLLATAIFLMLGFIWNNWHPSWVVFPIGGILCAIVSTILKGMGDKNK